MLILGNKTHDNNIINNWSAIIIELDINDIINIKSYFASSHFYPFARKVHITI